MRRVSFQEQAQRSLASAASLLQRSGFPIERFLRFGVVGVSGLAIDMLMLYLFYGVLKLDLTPSSLLAAEIAIVNNFIWNDLWTFGDIASQQRRVHQILQRFLKFNAVCFIGVILKVLLLSALSHRLHLNVYIANLLAIATVTFWNFWINMKLSWRTSKKKRNHTAIDYDKL